MSTKTDKALERLGDLASGTTALENQAAKAKAKRDQAIVRAQAAGATYPQIAAAAGITRDRVAQIIARSKRDAK